MGRLGLFLAVGLLSGCGPGLGVGSTDGGSSGFSVEMANEYAVSIFTVNARPEGWEGRAPQPIFTDERIESGESATSKVKVEAFKGVRTELWVVGTSLGDQYVIGPLYTKDGGSGTYRITYDYDLATARFGVSHGWR